MAREARSTAPLRLGRDSVGQVELEVRFGFAESPGRQIRLR